MTNRFTLIVAVLATLTALGAQDAAATDHAAASETQSPRAPEHDALLTLVGTWSGTSQLPAMPGVPGMEKPTEVSTVDRAESICNGLWLKWSSTGTAAGDVCEGIWLAGYDPLTKRYISFWVDNRSPAPAEMTGTYDAAAKRWTWIGSSADGEMRSEMTWKDSDTLVETVTITAKGTDEPQVMQITRKRAKAAPATVAADPATSAATLAPDIAALARGLGDWDATIRSYFDPSQPPAEDKGHERVRVACCGKYTWSDFQGSMMGAPFEGHAVVGYDAEQKQLVSYWIDSMAATWSKTTGTVDEKTGAIAMTGTSPGPDGKPLAVRESLRFKDADTRSLRMDFGADGDAMQFALEIAYRRATKSAAKN